MNKITHYQVNFPAALNDAEKKLNMALLIKNVEKLHPDLRMSVKAVIEKQKSKGDGTGSASIVTSGGSTKKKVVKKKVSAKQANKNK